LGRDAWRTLSIYLGHIELWDCSHYSQRGSTIRHADLEVKTKIWLLDLGPSVCRLTMLTTIGSGSEHLDELRSQSWKEKGRGVAGGMAHWESTFYHA
jgi:hypothetical protein